MRQIISLTLSAAEAERLKKTAKQRGFASVSAYLRHLVRQDESTITEDQLLEDLKSAQRDYRAGRIITANSLADLIKKR